MTLTKIIKKQLTNISQKNLLKAMGYNNIDIGRKTLQSLLDAEDIYSWIKDGHFDLRYTSKQFIIKLCEILEVSDIDYEVILDQYEQRARNISSEPLSYIYVNTNFKRKNEPVFALAIMERIRRVVLDQEILFDMRKEEVIAYVSKIVQEHYRESKGSLKLWGPIQNYVFHYKNEETIIFDVHGNIAKGNVEVSETKAVVKINNQLIF